MKQFYLAEIITKDKLVHQGIFYKPTKPSGRAIVWVHGLTDNFYGDRVTLETFAHFCEKEGWGLASFNTRGHDIVTSITKRDTSSPTGKTSVMLGAASETFTDCIYDVGASISFLHNQGFSQIILIGMSTGANKVCYYAGTQEDSRVHAVILVSAVSDVAIKRKELEQTYTQTVQNVEAMVTQRKGESLVEGIDYMPLTPKRYLSLYKENSQEDVFPYYQKKPKFTVYARIQKPLMVIMGGSDEYADIPVRDIVTIYARYQKSSNFKSIIIPGALHSFGGKETELVASIATWVRSLDT